MVVVGEGCLRRRCIDHNNLVEVRTDALKMIYATRRVPADDSATGIGPWERVFKLLSFAGVIVNLAYIGITSDFFEQLSHHIPELRQTGNRVIVLVAAEHVLLLLKMLVDWVVPDVPDSVKVKMEREDYIEEKLQTAHSKGLMPPVKKVVEDVVGETVQTL